MLITSYIDLVYLFASPSVSEITLVWQVQHTWLPFISYSHTSNLVADVKTIVIIINVLFNLPFPSTYPNSLLLLIFFPLHCYFNCPFNPLCIRWTTSFPRGDKIGALTNLAVWRIFSFKYSISNPQQITSSFGYCACH